MKKLLALILTLATLLVLAACGETPVTPTEATTETATTAGTIAETIAATTATEQTTTTTAEETAATEATTTAEPTTPPEPESEYISGVEMIDKYISYNEIVKMANQTREEMFADPNPFEDASKYIYQPEDESTLLTRKEIKLLQDSSRSEKSSVTYDEAVYDIDVYFRALKYAYGPYYYAGGDELFNMLHENILNDLNGYKNKTIQTGVLKNIINKHMAVVRDAHMNGSNPYFNNQYRCEYFYCKNQYYALDDGGYYKYIDGEKWYYVSCESKYVTMQPTAKDNGKVAYSLVRFCPLKDENGNAFPSDDDIVLQHNGIEKKQNVTWIQNQAFGYVQGTGYEFIRENGITYISQRGFMSITGSSKAAEEYREAGWKARGSNVVIFDFRSNSGGGSDDLYGAFVKGLAGEYANMREYHAIRYNALNQQFNTRLGNERIEVLINSKGRIIKNNTPIIILVDDYCGSGGDEIFCTTRTLENVIVIGSNNGGLYINDVMSYYLPNSAIVVRMGGRFWPHYSMENRDGIGHEPDIWCNPKDALDVALKFIETNGLAEKETVDAMRTHFPATTLTTDSITLYFEDQKVEMHSSEVMTGMSDTAIVMFDGVPATDFDVSSSSSFATIEKVDGKIKITPLKSGRIFKFRIHYDGLFADFYWTVP